MKLSLFFMALSAMSFLGCVEGNNQPPTSSSSKIRELSKANYGRNASTNAPLQDFDFIRGPEFLEGNLEVQIHETTYAQWDVLNSFLPAENQNPWSASNCSGKFYIDQARGPSFPAPCISAADAKAYIDVLNQIDLQYQYRLPTERELTLLTARSIGQATTDWKISEEKMAPYAWFAISSDQILQLTGRTHAHEVCTKKTIFGLCDILGNLREWTSTEDREIWDKGPLKRFALGGSWNTLYFGLDPFYRDFVLPIQRNSTTGFRLVRSSR